MNNNIMLGAYELKKQKKSNNMSGNSSSLSSSSFLSADKSQANTQNTLINEIKNKSASEPSWLVDISKNLIHENQIANQMGDKKLINDTNNRLKSFNIDLNGFNEMNRDTKNKAHIVDFTKERYKPLNINQHEVLNSFNSGNISSSTGIKDILSNMKKTGGYSSNNNTFFKELGNFPTQRSGFSDFQRNTLKKDYESDYAKDENISLYSSNTETPGNSLANMDAGSVEKGSSENHGSKEKNREEIIKGMLIPVIGTGIEIFTSITDNELDDYFFSKGHQQAIWKFGAEYYLRRWKNFQTSAWMLEHSLEDNPSDIRRGNDSNIAYLINNDPVYLNALDDAIAKSDGKTIDADLEKIRFSTGDLLYSIHKADIHVTGYKRDDGKWIIKASLEDTYDFTKFMTGVDNNGISPATVANDVAVISQYLGAIHPYKVYVDFYTTR